MESRRGPFFRGSTIFFYFHPEKVGEDEPTQFDGQMGTQEWMILEDEKTAWKFHKILPGDSSRDLFGMVKT